MTPEHDCARYRCEEWVNAHASGIAADLTGRYAHPLSLTEAMDLAIFAVLRDLGLTSDEASQWIREHVQ